MLNAVCPEPVPRPFMDQDWLQLSFLHWPLRRSALARLLPRGLEPHTFDGYAWVTMVPFLLRVRLPRGPVLPWIGVFPEVNVRTYVVGPGGNPGIWFFSLDAPRRLAIWGARLTYWLPYRTAVMAVRSDRDVRSYASWRIEGPNRGASMRACVEVGTSIEPHDITALEHFLTARWRLYTSTPFGLAEARVEHPPWHLHRAAASDLDVRLLNATGLRVAHDVPLVHACDDVHASLTKLRRCGPASAVA
ncbi:MAG: YqjF family protein [Candidatus Dormibacteria bacterium]